MAVNLTDILNGEDRETVKTLAKEKSIEDDYGIIYGSNANGNWTKFPNGTLICRNTVTIIDYSPSSPQGALYRGSQEELATYPMPFVSSPQVATSVGFHLDVSVNVIGSSITSLEGLLMSTDSGTYTRNFSYIAIGRWK